MYDFEKVRKGKNPHVQSHRRNRKIKNLFKLQKNTPSLTVYKIMPWKIKKMTLHIIERQNESKLGKKRTECGEEKSILSPLKPVAISVGMFMLHFFVLTLFPK